MDGERPSDVRSSGPVFRIRCADWKRVLFDFSGSDFRIGFENGSKLLVYGAIRDRHQIEILLSC